MKINKYLNKSFRAGHWIDRRQYNLNEQEEAGVTIAICGLIALIFVILAVIIN